MDSNNNIDLENVQYGIRKFLKSECPNLENIKEIVSAHFPILLIDDHQAKPRDDTQSENDQILLYIQFIENRINKWK